MAPVKLLLASFLLLFILNLAQTHPGSDTKKLEQGTRGSLLDCDAACGVRCSKSSRPNLCNRVCGTCCERCSCVPPGTYGNYDSCPCYGALTTHGGQRKCP